MGYGKFRQQHKEKACVLTDINNCQEENASDFGKCSIKAGADGQILLKSDDGYRIFEK